MVDTVHNIAASYPPSGRLDAVTRRADTRAADHPVIAADKVPPASPQINIDPVVGVIVEFINSSGSVESQSPSFAAEAYIRAGLTADGFSKEDSTTHTQLTA